MTVVGSVTQRYDRSARRYERWWAPVLRPTVEAFVEEIAPLVDRVAAPRILDVGTGTGSLAVALLRRLPAAGLTAVDGSQGMMDEAERVVAARLTPDQSARLEFREGLADRLPFPDGTFDLVASSFVLQLVPSRTRALREARRVLRPGGWVAYVAWRRDRAPFEPDAAWGRALDAADAPDAESEDEGGGRPGDIPSAAAAAAQLRRTGFESVRAQETILERAWTRRTFLDFIERYDEADYLEGLDPTFRRRIHDAARREFAAVRPEAFIWRTPVVIAVGRRPAESPGFAG
jgi:SAM-dependent methyltransferase